MSKLFLFKNVSLVEVRNFIEQNHYSKSVNGCKVSYCFAIYSDGNLVGAALFGQLSTTAWKKYSQCEGDVVELRRLVCHASCPKNTESWFISKCLKFLRKNSPYKICISYADPRYGHVGYVYQASNWNYLGQTAKDTILVTPDGREYHSRALRTKYKGELKPFAKKLNEMQINGELLTVTVPGKHIYTYTIKGKHECTTSDIYPKLTDL